MNIMILSRPSNIEIIKLLSVTILSKRDSPAGRHTKKTIETIKAKLNAGR